MQKYNLKASKRTNTGKKVKKLRQAGLLPANVYGKHVKSTSVELSLLDFQKIYKKAGETSIIDLAIASDLVKPVLIHNVQRNVITKIPLHVDFYQVDLKQKIRTKVPVILIGKSPIVDQKAGLLLQTLNEVEIEALPTDLPNSINIDISSLTEVGQELKTDKLKMPSGVILLTDKNIGVVKVAQLISKEAEELAKQEQAASDAAKAATQSESSTIPTGESPVVIATKEEPSKTSETGKEKATN